MLMRDHFHSRIPPSISMLQNLRRLDLSNNKLRYVQYIVPPSIVGP